MAGQPRSKAVSEYSEVEEPFLHQLTAQGWSVIDRGNGIVQNAAPSLRRSFQEWLLPDVFDAAGLGICPATALHEQAP